MTTLQLRLDADTRLRDIAADIIIGIKDVLTENLPKGKLTNRNIYQLVRLTRRRLERAVEVYSVCGDKLRCHAACRDYPIGGPWISKKISEKQQILLLRETPANLSAQLDADIFDYFYPDAPTELWISIKPQLDEVLEESLGPLLYENPCCDQCSRCTNKTKRSPWIPLNIKQTRPSSIPDNNLSR